MLFAFAQESKASPIFLFFQVPSSSLNSAPASPRCTLRWSPAWALRDGTPSCLPRLFLPVDIERHLYHSFRVPRKQEGAHTGGNRVAEPAPPRKCRWILRQIFEVRGESWLCRPLQIQSPALCYRWSPWWKCRLIIQTCLLLILYLEEIKRNNYLGVTFCHLYKATCTWDFASSRNNELNAKYFIEKRRAGLLKINLKDLHVFWSYIPGIKLHQR